MKQNLKKKIVMGVCSAAFMSQTVLAFAGSAPQARQVMDSAPLTAQEQAFARRLSNSAKDVFTKMSESDRQAVMKIVLHACKGQNACKGQGGCKSDANACKGQNSCKGKGQCKVGANDAVMMIEKRNCAM